MSILLKALKKSEAQRRVGGPPDIHAPMDLSQDRQSAGHWLLPLVLIALSAVVIAWFGWRQYHAPEALTVSDRAEAVKPEAAVEQTSEDSGPAAGEPIATEMLDVRPSAPPAVVNFPSGKQQEAEERKQKLSRSFSQFAAEPKAAAAENGPAEPGAENGENGSAGADADPEDFSRLEAAVNAIAQEQPPDPRAKQDSTMRASRSGSRSSESVEPAGESEPISFWQVPQSLRDNMPEFRITVLVYAEEPADRFVLVNGVRLVEKEELAAGVTLDEIRRDGAVFRYRNYRFLVKG